MSDDERDCVIMPRKCRCMELNQQLQDERNKSAALEVELGLAKRRLEGSITNACATLHTIAKVVGK